MVMLDETRTSSGRMVLNMGPQHPSTHGVLRLVLELDGENVLDCAPDVGYLHTGIEKMAEARNYHQALVLTDRTDYLAPVTNNLSYVLACEKLFGVEGAVPERAQVTRVVMSELTRIASHLVWLGTHALDLGAMTLFMYCWREREQVLEIMEAISGVRMMTSFMRIGGLAADLPDEFGGLVERFLQDMPRKLDEYETLLTRNPIFVDRTKGVGIVGRAAALEHGLAGSCLRSSGVKFDVRVNLPYCGYETYEFDVPWSSEGDVYARYLVRMREMRESLRIIAQGARRLEASKGASIRIDDPRITFPRREKLHTSMESLIHHFKLVSEGPVPAAGEAYASVESPRGEQATYIMSDGSNKPHRVRFRGPSFYNLQVLPQMIAGGLVADVVACIGSIDIVLGEIDR